LEVEMDDHLGYPKACAEGRDKGNSRNGSRSKTVLTGVGKVEIQVLRDRDGSFDPKIVPPQGHLLHECDRERPRPPLGASPGTLPQRKGSREVLPPHDQKP